MINLLKFNLGKLSIKSIALLLISWLTITFGHLLPAQAIGTVTNQIAPSIPTLGTEQQTYNISFRDNGEALVGARLVIGNMTSSDRQEVSLDFGDTVITEPVFYQQILSANCGKSLSDTCNSNTAPDYRTEYFGDYTVIYEPLTFINTNGKLVIKLKNPIKSSGSGAIIMSFRTMNYTKAVGHNTYKIDYHTPQYDRTIDIVTINLGASINKYVFRFNNIDINNLNYQTGVSSPKNIIDASTESNMATLNDFTSSIYQNFVATTGANALVRGESFTVQGEYSQSIWMLYRHTLLAWLSLGIVIIIFAILCIVVLMPKIKWDQKYNPWRDIGFYIKTLVIGSLALLKAAILFIIFSMIGSNLFNALRVYNNFSNNNYTWGYAMIGFIMIIASLILNISTIIFLNFIFRIRTRFGLIISFLWQLLYFPIVAILLVWLFSRSILY